MESLDLRKAGLKVTHPRMRILALMDEIRPRHMTAEDIYRHLLEQGDEIGLATVYRVLTQFEAAGLVLKHTFEGGGQAALASFPTSTPPSMRASSSSRAAASSTCTALWVMPSRSALLTR